MNAPRFGRSGHRIALVYLFLVVLAVFPTQALDENLTKGATTNHIFESGAWGESIDLLNGGLNLTIPLGPTYSVSSDVSYQLKLAYSSKIWSIENASSASEYYGGNRHYRQRSRLHGGGQAGLGFMLQMGRYLKRANSAECATMGTASESRLMEEAFEDATGASHPALAYGRGSVDGSNLVIDPNSVKVPDGTRYVLDHEVGDLRSPADPNSDWPKCSHDPNAVSAPLAALDIFTNDYRGNYVTRIEGKDRDANGEAYNWVQIDYETDDGMEHLMKSIVNCRNKVCDDAEGHYITFTNSREDPTHPGDHDYDLPMGYVKSITIPVFSSNPNSTQTATYTFSYTLADIEDPYVLGANDPNDYYAVDNPDGKVERVLLLTGITFPQGYIMGFGYTDTYGHNVGYVQHRDLPTGARIQYEYGWYQVAPLACRDIQTYGTFCWAQMSGSHYSGWTQHITSKRIIPDPNQASESYTWTYARDSVGFPNPPKVVVTDPFGNDTITYFHADLNDTWYDFGQGIYQHNDLWRNGRPYETGYYRGSSANVGNRVRTEKQVWEDDVDNPTANYYRHTGYYPRVTESKVIYSEDGGKTSRVAYEEYDGFGNFRKTTDYGFDGLPYRIHRVDYNCDVRDQNGECFDAEHASASLDPNHLANWVLGTYTYSETLAPDNSILERSEYKFDDRGRLRAKVDRISVPAGGGAATLPGDPNTPATGDVKTEYLYDDVDSQCPDGVDSFYSGSVCYKKVTDSGATSGVFEEKYSYPIISTQSGDFALPYLDRRKVSPFNWYADDREVDSATGLTRVSRDPSGIETTFDYDNLGRLLSVTPDTVADPNNVTELPAYLTYPDIWTTVLEQTVDSSNKIHSQFSFDRLGRLIEVQKRQRDGSVASQKTTYDIAGRVTWQGEWGDPNTVDFGDPNHGTTFDYTDPLSNPLSPVADPFGRVRMTTTADGKIMRTDYAGTTSAVRIEGIETSIDPAHPSSIVARTLYQKDAFGRLTQVLSPRTYTTNPSVCSYLPSGVDAYYTYDRLDRLTMVRLESMTDPNSPSCPTSSQYRSFSYDALSRQVSATNPENGTVLNLGYDAAGNLLGRQDAKGRVLSYTYDGASRLTSAWLQTGSGNISLLENTYDDPNTGYGFSAGKLTRSVAYDDTGVAVLREDYRYNGMNGRLSQDGRRYGGWNPAYSSIDSQAEILTNYRYNSLGFLSQLTYPEKSGLSRTVLNPYMTYANGYLTAVADPNRGSLVSSVEYNSAGGVSSITTRGDVQTQIPPDVRNRPSSITVTKLGQTPVTHFDSGAYGYDGAGNIRAIGQDRFGYDALNRLTGALITDPAVSGKTETMNWSYDPLGNMVYQGRTTQSPPNSQTHTNRNFEITNKNQVSTVDVDQDPGGSTEYGLDYDGNGNLIKDQSFEYVYDSRNRLLEVRNLDASLVAQYTYDGAGYRLSKYDGETQMTTYFVRDASGQTLSEFRRPGTAGTPSWLRDYVYAVGRHVAMVENDVPATPGGISSSVSASGQTPFVSLSWQANTELDIDHYGGKRTCCELFDPPPEPVFFTTSSPQYYDTSVVANRQYKYVIWAVDSAGNISSSTQQIVVKPGDSQAPSPPTAGTAVAEDGLVRLTWSEPSTTDLAGCKVYRKVHSSGTWQNVAGLIHKGQNGFIDTTAENEVSYDYQVRAVDSAGLESTGAPSDGSWQELTPHDTTPPEAPYGLWAVAEDTSIHLVWVPSTEQVSSYKVYRDTQPITSAAQNLLIGDPNGAGFDDSDLQADQTYYYRVSAVDNSPRSNESVLSEELAVLTRVSSSSIPAPTISTSQAQAWTWDYCNSSGIGSIFSYFCYLSHSQDLVYECLRPDDPNTSEADWVWDCPPWTHENSRTVAFGWSAGSTGAELKSFRIYGRRSSSEPWQLWEEYDRPWFIWMKSWGSTGLSHKIYNHYPIAVPVPENLPANEYRYQDHAFNSEDTCSDITYRVSAVDTNGRESMLSTEAVTLAKKTLPPENLHVPAESIDTESCQNCNRLNPQYYGLTLNWAPGGSICGSTTGSYHVYRSRRKQYCGGTTFPIRLTRQPVSAPIFRVDYLPLMGPDAYVGAKGIPTSLFEGPKGNGGSENFLGDKCAIEYAVSSVDGAGDESTLSNHIFVHTDDPNFTDNDYRDYAAFNGAYGYGSMNTENSCSISLFHLPDPNTPLPVAPVTSPTWEWKFGDNADLSNVGPYAGNWAKVTWTLPAQDPNEWLPNDFRLLRQRPGEGEYSEVPLDLVPGDDSGIRQFVWAMPLELACEDANYAIQSFDVYDHPGGIAYFPQTIEKRRLVPENFSLTGMGSVFLRARWDPLPECQAGSSSHYVVSYSIMVSEASCTGQAPDPNTYSSYTSVAAGGLTDVIFEPESQSGSYWWAIRADWSDGPSTMSAPTCRVGGGQQVKFLDTPLGDGEVHSYIAENGGPLERLQLSIADAGRFSPHRVIGQTGGSDPSVSLYFYHVDHLGTPRVITDVGGNVVSRHKYLPYGEELSPSPSSNTHQFTGHERDHETGADYMLARAYSPKGTFRFMSVDPAFKPSKNVYSPQRWNRYIYSASNPIKFFDPDGRDFTAAADPQTKTVTIKVNVVMTGPGASSETAGKFQDQANKTFAAGATTFKGKDGTTWNLKVEVNATTDTQKFSDKDRPNTLTVSDGGKTEMTSANQGTLNTSDLQNPNTAAHEAAHMIGVEDQYDKNTNQPLPGKEGSLMGDPKNPDAKLTQEEAQKAGEQGEKYVEATKKDDQ